MSDVAADSGETGDTYGVARQYFDSTGFADAGQKFSAATQAISDTEAQPEPTSSCPVPNGYGYTACVTDAEIESELTRLIAAGGLPTGTGAGAPLYFVITPPTTDVCFGGTGGGGCADPVSDTFCAYHSNFLDGSNQVIYAVVPFATEAYGAKGCQEDATTAPQYPNGVFADTVADTLSHESNESITDPIVTRLRPAGRT